MVEGFRLSGDFQWTEETIATIGEARGLPKLRELSLRFLDDEGDGSNVPRLFEALLTSPLGRRLETLAFDGDFADAHFWWQAATRHRDAFKGRLSVRSYSVDVALDLDGDGNRSLLRIKILSKEGPPDTDDLVTFLDLFPPNALSRVEIVGRLEETESIRRAAERQQRPEALDLSGVSIGSRAPTPRPPYLHFM